MEDCEKAAQMGDSIEITRMENSKEINKITGNHNNIQQNTQLEASNEGPEMKTFKEDSALQDSKWETKVENSKDTGMGDSKEAAKDGSSSAVVAKEDAQTQTSKGSSQADGSNPTTKIPHSDEGIKIGSSEEDIKIIVSKEDGNIENLEESDTEMDNSIKEIPFVNVKRVIESPTDEIKEVESTTTITNPVVPEDELSPEELKRLRGDAIGNTMYSERFILNVLLRLQNVNTRTSLEDDPPFETELCQFWDMTIEIDIVKYLIDKDVLCLFINCINISHDQRLIEVLVGIIGNMCVLEEACAKLCTETSIAILMDLINCGDAPTIIALLRLFTVYLYYADEDNKKEWLRAVMRLPHILEFYCDTMGNSMNMELISQAIITLNDIAITYDKFAAEINADDENAQLNFRKTFARDFVIKSLMEAFETYVDIAHKEIDNENLFFEKPIRKTVCHFLDLLSLILPFNHLPKSEYNELIIQLLEQIKFMFQSTFDPMFLKPIDKCSLDILESINNLYYVLDYPYDMDIFLLVISNWYKIKVEREELPKRKAEFDESVELEDEEEFDEFCRKTFNLIVCFILSIDSIALKETFDKIEPKITRKLLVALNEDDDEDKKYCRTEIMKCTNIMET